MVRRPLGPRQNTVNTNTTVLVNRRAPPLTQVSYILHHRSRRCVEAVKSEAYCLTLFLRAYPRQDVGGRGGEEGWEAKEGGWEGGREGRGGREGEREGREGTRGERRGGSEGGREGPERSRKSDHQHYVISRHQTSSGSF